MTSNFACVIKVAPPKLGQVFETVRECGATAGPRRAHKCALRFAAAWGYRGTLVGELAARTSLRGDVESAHPADAIELYNPAACGLFGGGVVGGGFSSRRSCTVVFRSPPRLSWMAVSRSCQSRVPLRVPAAGTYIVMPTNGDTGPVEGVAPSSVVVKIGSTASPGARFLSQVELLKILIVDGMRCVSPNARPRCAGKRHGHDAARLCRLPRAARPLPRAARRRARPQAPAVAAQL